MIDIKAAALALANAERARFDLEPLANLDNLKPSTAERCYDSARAVLATIKYPAIEGTVLIWHPIELANKDGAFISVPVLAEMGQYDIVRAKWSFGLQAWVKDGRLMDPQPTLFCKVLEADTLPSSHTAKTEGKVPNQESASTPV